ncbi:hypothetical protein ACOSQ3_020183 [Xanthoceras sorbifolium]
MLLPRMVVICGGDAVQTVGTCPINLNVWRVSSEAFSITGVYRRHFLLISPSLPSTIVTLLSTYDRKYSKSKCYKSYTISISRMITFVVCSYKV